MLILTFIKLVKKKKEKKSLLTVTIECNNWSRVKDTNQWHTYNYMSCNKTARLFKHFLLATFPSSCVCASTVSVANYKHLKWYFDTVRWGGNKPFPRPRFCCCHVNDLLLQQPTEQSQWWAGPRCSVFSPFRMSQRWSRVPIGSCLQTRHNHD